MNQIIDGQVTPKGDAAVIEAALRMVKDEDQVTHQTKKNQTQTKEIKLRTNQPQIY